MKEMKKEDNVLETVVFTYSEDQVLRELIAESSYVAKCRASDPGLVPGWSSTIIVSEDDRPFFTRRLADVRDEIMRALAPHLSGEFASTETELVFAVLLPQHRPLALDESICHQLERTIVSYILWQWFATKLPDESERCWLQYQGALSAVKSDIRLARNRRPHRPMNYF